MEVILYVGSLSFSLTWSVCLSFSLFSSFSLSIIENTQDGVFYTLMFSIQQLEADTNTL